MLRQLNLDKVKLLNFLVLYYLQLISISWCIVCLSLSINQARFRKQQKIECEEQIHYTKDRPLIGKEF